jgi:hypothetical protein
MVFPQSDPEVSDYSIYDPEGYFLLSSLVNCKKFWSQYEQDYASFSDEQK